MGLLSLRHNRPSNSSPSASSSSLPSTKLTAKNAVKTTLILLEKAAEASSVPFVKGSLGVILELVKIAEKQTQNKESLDELVNHLRRLEDAMIRPLLSKQSLGVPSDLEARVRRFTEELVALANDWKALKSSHRRIVSFFNHEDYTAEIARLNKLIGDSLAAFLLESQISTAIVGESTHRAVARMEQHLLSKEIQGLRRAHAAYDSTSRSNAPKCFQGTRLLVFDMLRKWITDKEGPRTCVLEGIAGVGKTTIAQTLAEEEAKINRLAASFIFSRDENERNKADLLFTTVAFQLAQRNKEFADRISMTLQQSPEAQYKTFAEQLKKLIVEPLQDLPQTTLYPNLIILDALDECENEGASQILELLLSQLPFFKILITTRPEPHLRAILDAHRAHESLILHEVDNMVVESDIRSYLKHQLTEPEIRKVVPGCEWRVEAKDLDALVKASGRLFIVASTAEKFIKHPVQADPQHQLRVLLNAFNNKEEDDGADLSPHTTLDRLYSQVLDTAMPLNNSSRNIVERFQAVVGSIIVLQDPLLPPSLAALLGLNTSSISAVLSRLQSVIVSSSNDHCPRVYHPSFPDYITNPTRCKQPRFLIRPPEHHSRMATRCFDVMSRLLRRNICDIQLPDQYLENDTIPNLPAKVTQCIPAELIYACSYWALHLSKAQSGVAELLCQLESFTFNHLLSWIELLSLTGKVRLGYPALVHAHEFSTSQGGSTRLLSMLYDGQRFILTSQEIIKVSALHVYYSALPFTPSDTTLFQAYKHEAEHSVQVLRGQGTSWDPLLAVLVGHSDLVRCVAFTPDGKRIASGSSDHTIKLWDGATGVHISTLQGHSGWVWCVAFTPDGKRLASGSSDNTIKMWDGVTGDHVATLDGHSGPVRRVAFTADGKRLASGSGDNTIKLWGGASWESIATLRGHSDCINSISFTPDGMRLASGSSDETVMLWEGVTGVHVATLKGHSGAIRPVAFTPDGRRLASGSLDKTIKLWDAVTGVCLTTLEGHSDYINSIAFTSDGKRIASGSDDKTIRLWDGATGAHLATLEGHSGYILSMAFTSDGKRLVSASEDTTIKLWDGVTGLHTTTLGGHYGRVVCVAFTPDGQRFASGSSDNTIRLWDGTTRAQSTNLGSHSNWIYSVKFTDAGARLISKSTNGQIQEWDVASGAEVIPPPTLSTHLDDSTSSTSATPPPSPSVLFLGDRNDLHAVVAKTSQAAAPLPVCFLPLGSSIRTSASTDSHIAVGTYTGQLFILDTSQVQLR